MNASKAIPTLVLQLDRPRQATFNLYAICRLEDHFEKQKIGIGADGRCKIWDALDWNNLNARDCALLLWAALLSDDENLSPVEAQKLCTAAGLMESVESMVNLVNDLIDRAAPLIDSESLAAGLTSLQKKTAKIKKKPAAATI